MVLHKLPFTALQVQLVFPFSLPPSLTSTVPHSLSSSFHPLPSLPSSLHPSPPLPSSLTQHLVGLPAPPDLVFQEQSKLLEGVSGRAHPLPHTLLCLPVGREEGEEGEGWAQATGEELNAVWRLCVFTIIDMNVHCRSCHINWVGFLVMA